MDDDPVDLGTAAQPVARRGRRSIKTNFVAAATVNIAGAGLGFIASVIVTRALGPIGRGKFSYVLNALGVLVMVASSGGLIAVTRVAASGRTEPRRLYRPAALVGLLAALLADAVFLVVWLIFADSLFSGVGAGSLIWVAILVPPTLVLGYLSLVAALDDRVIEYAVASLLSTAVYLVTVTTLAAGHNLTFRTAVPAWSICSLLPIAVVWRAIKQPAGPHGREMFRRMVRFAAVAHLADLAMLLVLRADVLVVKARRGYAELGQYAVAVGIAEILLQAGIGLRYALIPLQGASSEHDRDSLRRGLAQSIRIGLLIGIATFVAAVFLVRPALSLVYGHRFVAASPAVIWLLPGVVAQTLQGPIRDFLLTEGKLRLATVSAAAMLVLNVALNIVLLKTHTFVASAGLSSLAYMGNFIACLIGFLTLTHIRLRDVLLPRRGDVELFVRLVRR